MSRLRISDLAAFETYLEARPQRLGCWRAGATSRHALLGWLNAESAVRLRSLVQSGGSQADHARQNVAHHNQVGIAAGWIDRFLRGPDRSTVTDEEDRQALFNVAGKYWGLRNLLIEARVGIRAFESQGSLVRLPYLGDDRRIDALDRMFDVLEIAESVSKTRPTMSDAVKDWVRSSAIRSLGWRMVPRFVRTEFRRMAESTLSSYEQYLEPQAAIGGFTLAEYDCYWVELMAWGMYTHGALLLGGVDPEIVCPSIERTEFITWMAEHSNISVDSARLITDLLTLDLARCRDGALTPLVRVDSAIVPMSSLIMPGAPRRNLLAILQENPSSVGNIGQLLGAVGERETAAVLERMSPDTLIATRVKVSRANGESAGDLDVVAADPVSCTMAIFEIKWHIAADGNAEVYKVENTAIKKRAQVVRLREEMASGRAVARWPNNWPDVTHYDRRWFVLTRDVLAQQKTEDDSVTIRSTQMLKRLLQKNATVTDLIALLDSPPYLPSQLHDTRWERVRYGELRVEAEFIMPN